MKIEIVNNPFTGTLSDFWVFNGSQWLLIGGTMEPYALPVYERNSPNAFPGSRSNAVTWTKSDGSIWIYGGLRGIY